MNTNIIYLSSRDFGVDQAPKGPVLVNSQKGIMFCLFHADPDKCSYCLETIPEVKRLALKMPAVKFGFVNLNRDRDVYLMSTKTIAPIDRVPFIILYVNGRPLMRYDGDKKAESMLTFLGEVISRLNNKKDFFENKNFRLDSDIPTFINTPQFNVVCDTEKGVCYVESGKLFESSAAQLQPNVHRR